MECFQQKDQALGSEVVLTLVTAGTTELFELLWQKINEFERQFSRFLAQSELSQFNHRAGERVAISPTFVALLKKVKQQAVATNGLFNPFILPALERAGYDYSWITGSPALSGAKNVVPAEQLTVGEDWAHIPAGTALDLGGIGKGYLLDSLANLVTADFSGYWFSLGGDILANGKDAVGLPWQIGIQSARDLGKTITEVVIPNPGRLAVATSGVTKRRGVKDGRPWHHLIDPRTGEPAETDVLTATVCAPSATEADVYASCAVILGKEDGQRFLREKGITEFYLQ